MTLLRCIGTEWLKRKRSLATWLVLGNGLFVPGILFLVRMRHPARLPALYRAAGFWETLWSQSWESMAIMMLPMFIILATSLIGRRVRSIRYQEGAGVMIGALASRRRSVLQLPSSPPCSP